MTLVVDASIAVKWYFEQPGTDAARAIAASDETLIAPDLIHAECGSAIWRYVRANVISEDKAKAIMPRLLLRLDRFTAISELTDEALNLAIALNHPIYDCFYLALARQEAAPLVTADKRLAALAERLSGVDIRLIGS
ncbi:MAG: type II toxin-antitoxin system VapC family toxin [Rhodomicrobium sp.]|nr:type II toxin-antitoxin system VapC family toxin [Rhodomicrobium sp.]